MSAGDGGGEPEVDGGPPACVADTRQLDLLLMVDNSSSMTEEQGSLNLALPPLLVILASGDTNLDGVPDFDPLDDIHVGVITADMGTGGNPVPTCTNTEFGDDGILRTSGNTARSGCDAVYPSFLSYTPGAGSPYDFATDVTCVAAMGTGGCGFEQQLEAVLKAVTPSTSSLRFVGGTTGHANGENAGFLRPGAVLVVLLLTDEEDCSALDPEIFDPKSTTYTGDLNLRCFNYPGAVHPIDRFVDGLLATRSLARRLVYAAITGVPIHLEGEDYGYILDAPEMQERIDPMFASRLVPSCNVPGRGIAFPPRRIVSLAAELESYGAGSMVGSICTEDYMSSINRLIEEISFAARGNCPPSI